MQYDVTEDKPRVLSIYPTVTGLSFSYFESAVNLVDFGNIHTKLKGVTAKVDFLLDHLNPDIVITEDHKVPAFRRGKRTESVLKEINVVCKKRGVPTRAYSRFMIKGVFSCFDAHNKFDTAKLLATWFPEMEVKLPPKPKIWLAQHYRMGLFDSMAFAVAYFHTEG